eukprot:TRINITY_DN12355_c0_g2_i1.p1 TRINITY_DN12355_c0_g2~~TRINITY_DN12355_c0_g2_i1.p1  ORF type:complete len:726 (-),score=110.04 TRINITY_DN12355_c0_g2_i1:57-2234(-)
MPRRLHQNTLIVALTVLGVEHLWTVFVCGRSFDQRLQLGPGVTVRRSGSRLQHKSCLVGRDVNSDALFSSTEFVVTQGFFDKQLLQQYFAGRPWELASRLLQLGGSAVQVSLAWTAGRAIGMDRTERGAVLVRVVQSLGPAFIKAGQTLAQRPDIVGDEAAEALKMLQTGAKPFDNKIAHRIILEDLQHTGPLAPGVCPDGCDTEGQPLFRSFSLEPVAAASLGQVYRVTTHEGLQLALKVQRPGVARQLALDWVSVSFCAAVYQYFVPSLNDFSILVDTSIKGMMRELDYHNEAANAEEFARRHAFLGFVTVPRWVREFSGPQGRARVLATEWIFGRQISELPVELGREAVRMAVQACVVQLLLTGFVHADPHEGNLLFTDKGQLAFLDFGLMDTVEPQMMEGFAEGIQGVVASDWRRVTQAMQAVGFVSTPVQKLKDAQTLIYEDCDFEELVAAVEFQMKKEEGGESRFSAMASGLEKLSWRYLMLTPPYIILITRTFMTLEGIAEAVEPGFNIYEAALPVAIRRAISPQTRSGQAALRQAVLLEGGEVRWQRLEQLLAEADKAHDDSASVSRGSGRRGGEGPEFDVLHGLLGSSEGAALRRLFDDINLKAIVHFLASDSARTWRHRVATWLSEQMLQRQRSLTKHRTVQRMSPPDYRHSREKRVMRLIAARHWQKLLATGGILGVIASVFLLGNVACRVLLRAGFLSLVSSVPLLRLRSRRN